jgi:hypothetical protein
MPITNNWICSKYKDQFVTDYAVTTPEEDIAESWTFFVLAPPKGIPSPIALAFMSILARTIKETYNNICKSFPQ